jgi:hypothetical protein
MRKLCFRAVAASVLTLTPLSAVYAQQAVTLTDTSQQTTLTATVSEQARVTVPSGVAFTVNNVNASTAAAAATVTIDSIVLATATKQLEVSLQASAANFTPPNVGDPTWAAGDVSWNAAGWTNATGAAGTLSSAGYTTVATCTADAAACSTTGLVFTLGPKATVQRAGAHSLVVTWRFASIGL